VKEGEENYRFDYALFTGLSEEGWWTGYAVAFVCIYGLCFLLNVRIIFLLFGQCYIFYEILSLLLVY
jgi:hypothetical protein